MAVYHVTLVVKTAKIVSWTKKVMAAESYFLNARSSPLNKTEPCSFDYLIRSEIAIEKSSLKLSKSFEEVLR